MGEGILPRIEVFEEAPIHLASFLNVNATVCEVSHAVKLMLNRMGHNFSPLFFYYDIPILLSVLL